MHIQRYCKDVQNQGPERPEIALVVVLKLVTIFLKK